MVRRIMLRFSAVLAVVLTAGAVLAVTGPSATATQGQPVIAGQTNTATSATTIDDSGGPSGLVAFGFNYGVTGEGGTTGVKGSGGTTGVQGNGDTTGVSGVAPTGNGVYGYGGTYGVFGESLAGNGVVGLVTNGASAVVGQNFGTGIGVNASAPTGTAVHADSASGIALEIDGRSTFSTAGTAVIASGKKSVTVTMTGVTTSDFVLATVQGTGAFYVKNASAGSGKFTITINKAPTSPATVKVAYFVISAS